MTETPEETQQPDEPEIDETKGVPGQIMYEAPLVDAERAGKFVAGDVDTLEPEEEEEPA